MAIPILETKDDNIIEIDPESVTFVYGFIYNGRQFLANTTISNLLEVEPCLEWIKKTLIKTLVKENIIDDPDKNTPIEES